jgi:hypothetical protein
MKPKFKVGDLVRIYRLYDSSLSPEGMRKYSSWLGCVGRIVESKTGAGNDGNLVVNRIKRNLQTTLYLNYYDEELQLLKRS